MARSSVQTLPPVLLVLDASVIVTASARDWQQYPTVGTCILPQGVVDEMQFLLTHAPDPDLERVAREFSRFQVTNKWQSTELLATHPLLKAGGGHAISKKARLSLAVAKCAYGLAKRYPTRLVVLATNEQPQIQRLQVLQLPNLCGITGVGLRGWSQSGQRPIAVLQHWQHMKAMGLDDPTSGLVVSAGARSDINPNQLSDLHSGLSRAQVPAPSAARSPVAMTPGRAAASPRPTTQPRKPAKTGRNHLSKGYQFSNQPDFVSQIISLTGTIIVLSVVGWIAWNLFQPERLGDFWKDGSPMEQVQ